MQNRGKVIFVVGASRSGTTMMSRILGTHADVFPFHELHFFEQLWDGQAEALPKEEAVSLVARLIATERVGYLQDPDPSPFLKEAREIVSTMPATTALLCYFTFLAAEAVRNGKTIPCEQTPRNVFYLREILSTAPDSRAIVMIRDPRDVLLSQKRKWKRRFLGANNIPFKESVRAWFNYHPLVITRLWEAAAKVAQSFKNDQRVHFVRFEDMVENPEQTIKRLCDFLGISFSPEMLAVPHVGSSNRTDSPQNDGIDNSIAGSWQRGGLSKSEIAICERTASALMPQMDYALSGNGGPGPGLLLQYLVLPFKLSIAVLLNAGRTKNFFSAVRRRFS